MENIMHFHRIYPQLKVIVLKQNYRSTQMIINAALSFIKHNNERLPRVLPSVKKEFTAAKAVSGVPVTVAKLSSESAEYFYVIEKIHELKMSGTPYQDIAVMYRNNRDVEPILDLFKAAGIPFNLTRDINVLENYYVEKLIAFLAVIDNPHRDNELFKYLFSSVCGVHKEDLFKLSEYIYRHKEGLFSVLESEEHRSALELMDEAALLKVRDLLKALHVEKEDIPFADLAVRALHRSGVLTAILAGADNIFDLNQVNSFIAWLREQSKTRPGYDLAAFLADLSFMKEAGLTVPAQETYVNRDGVNLMTAHRSKGLEFPVVFILRCTGQNWESKRVADKLKLPLDLVIREESDILSDDRIEDERRLFYVACTRAKEQLICSYADKRDDGKELSLSGFLLELDIQYRAEENVELYEQKFRERVELQLAEDSGRWKEEVSKEILQKLVTNYKMNPTALNNYLKCPAYFKYNNLFRIPGEYSKFSALGSCVHKVLEIVFRQAAMKKKMAAWPEWETHYKIHADKVNLPKKEKEEVLHEGSKYLKGYYDNYHSTFHLDCVTEYNFHDHDVHFEDIPITGMIDKVEVLSEGRANVIDYKTGKPQSKNAIMGETKSSEGDYFRQLIFYQLLSEVDKKFPYVIESAIIDFIQPKDSGSYAREEFEITDENLDSMKLILKEVYQKIQALEFSPTEDQKKCRQYDRECEYMEFCRRK